MAEQLSWVDRINLGGGVHQSDLPLVERRLTHLFTRLGAWPVTAVDVWLRVKNRDESGMKTTLEVRVPSMPMLVATSRARQPSAPPSTWSATRWSSQLNAASAKYGEHGTASIRR